MKLGKIYIGTSGWKYRHWEGTFYPSDLKKKDQLKYFTAHFDTVELNNSFYRQPTLQNFKTWQEQAPANFTYAVKANRYFTHLKKLNVARKEIVEFLDACQGLEKKLGPVLFQLPPKWNINTERLERFLEMLPPVYHYTFEFRNPTWYHDEVFVLLKKYNCAFCIYDLAGHQSPILATANFVYIRLHGPGEKYQGTYSRSDLERWAKMCNNWLNEKKDVYLYFDNDQKGYAAFNAMKIKKMI
ncbi:DUF72 domain-containing protein [Pedobacter psychrodurus]|uniref:DUF72 domain-containing protein n=1 Tax=Pedobacter psychrodurus TaxID=2530456 RepID=UPI002931B019|nr:DUF72 domain-containing protein [Pedobacter psychrodurus]